MHNLLLLGTAIDYCVHQVTADMAAATWISPNPTVCFQFEVFSGHISSVWKALKKRVKSERLILQKLQCLVVWASLNVQTSDNVCEFFSDRSLLLIHLTQANIKPEPEESWFNMRRSQEYNAMRGMLLFVCVKCLFFFLFFCFQGPISRKSWKLFRPVKPVLVHLYRKSEKCMRLKLLV